MQKFIHDSFALEYKKHHLLYQERIIGGHSDFDLNANGKRLLQPDATTYLVP